MSSNAPTGTKRPASSKTTAAGWTNRTGVAQQLLEAVRELPVTIATIDTMQLLLPGAMRRITTTVQLHGAGATGRGEDVAYSADTQRTLPEQYGALNIAGAWTLGSLSARLDQLEPFVTQAPGGDDKPGFHRWAVESAALDLALQQRGCDLGELVAESFEPVQVSLSMGLGTPPTVDVVRRWLQRDASITFKLDTAMAWSHPLVQELAEAASGAVRTIDFKAMYTGDWVDNDYPASLYEAVARGLPDAVLEDARLDAESRDALDEQALRRLAWDYPITRERDVPGLAGSTARFSDLRPGAVNIKPSRFGSLEHLLGTIARCDVEQIPCYSGGQYELGIGRTQVQTISSLCFPDAPNDCAPSAFHGAGPDTPDLPLGPVHVPSGATGFGWDAPTPAAAI